MKDLRQINDEVKNLGCRVGQIEAMLKKEIDEPEEETTEENIIEAGM